MRYSQIPADVKHIVDQRLIEANHLVGDIKEEDITLDGMFIFRGTPEGKDIWWAATAGDFEPLRQFHGLDKPKTPWYKKIFGWFKR